MKVSSIFLMGGGIIAALGLSGCTTLVDVRPYSGPGQEGFRYSLPEPYLLVKPKPDGTASYEWVYLPNQESEYAVKAYSFLSFYKLVLTSDNSFLKSASFTGTATAPAAKIADLVGEVVGAKKDAEVAAEKATDKAAKDKAAADEKAAGDKVVAAEKALADARAVEILAQAEVDFYASPQGSGTTAASVLAANLALAKAKANVAEMQKRRDAIVLNSGGAQDAGAGSSVALQQQWGPMLFRLAPTTDGGVQLRAVKPQILVQTSGVAAKLPTAKAEDVAFSAPKISQMANGTSVSFVASEPVSLIENSQVLINLGTQAYTTSKATLTSQGNKALTLTLSPALPSGKYTAMIPYKPSAGQESASALSFTVP